MPHSLDPDVVPPHEGLARLRTGNARFVSGDGQATRSWHRNLALGQRPFAVVLACSDSRSPAEYVFDQGLGNLFVIRVAGNVVEPTLVGSVEFAVGEFGTRLVVVMGHTHCGGIRAAAHALEHGGAPESVNLRAIVDRITPHVRSIFDGPGDHDAHLAAAVRANAIATAAELRKASPILHNLVARGRVVIVAAVYDLSTGVVTFVDA